MSFPSDKSQDPSYSSSGPRIVTKPAHGQSSVWGSSSQQTSSLRKGLTPLSTAGPVGLAKPASPNPARNTPGAVNTSRHSSVSSSSSVLSPSATQSFTRYKPATSPHIGSTTFDRAPLPAGGTQRYSRQNSSAGLGHSSGASTPTSGQLTSLVLTQLNILLSTLKEDKDRGKWEAQVEKIWKVCHSRTMMPGLTSQLIDEHGMEVYVQYFRRLLTSNAAQVSGAAPVDSGSTYQLLHDEVRKLATDEQQASKIASALDSSDGDPKDFDLAAFVHHFKLDPIAVVALTVACKGVAKADIRSKGTSALSLDPWTH